MYKRMSTHVLSFWRSLNFTSFALAQEEWMNLHPAFRRDHELMLQRVNFEPFREVFLSDGARMGCPWRWLYGFLEVLRFL